MPELPEVERVRRSLEPAMTGARFERVQLNRRDLRQPFPTGFARRLRGQTVRALGRRGKYLLAELSSGETLLMHLGMSGWFRVEKTRPEKRRRDPDVDFDKRHDHVVFSMSSGMTVTFNDPRRLGMVPSSTMVMPLAATLSPMRPEKALVFLRLKSPSRPWPTASCSITPGQPEPSTTSISPAGAGTDSRLTSA